MASNLGFFAGGLADSTRKGLAQQEVRKRTDILQGQFDLQKQQFESDQDTKKQVQDLLAASEMNKQRAAATKDRLQGIDMMKRMRTIATQQDSATRASMVKGIVEEQKAKGVIISPTVVDMLKSGKTENLIPMINHWAAQMSASGSGGKEIMDTITNVDKSFAAIENAQFAQRNPQRAKAQQVKMFDKRIEDLGTAATKFAMNGNHQAATGMRAQQEQVIKDRARFTGEDKKPINIAAGAKIVDPTTFKTLAENTRPAAGTGEFGPGGLRGSLSDDKPTQRAQLKERNQIENQLAKAQSAMDAFKAAPGSGGITGAIAENVGGLLGQIPGIGETLEDGLNKMITGGTAEENARARTAALTLAADLLPEITGETSGRFTEAERELAFRALKQLKPSASSTQIAEAYRVFIEASVNAMDRSLRRSGETMKFDTKTKDGGRDYANTLIKRGFTREQALEALKRRIRARDLFDG